MSAEGSPAQSDLRSRLRSYLFSPKILFPAIILSLAALLMQWRGPTRVKVDVVVDRVEFTVGAEATTRVLDAVNFQTLHIEQFKQISFQPERLELADMQRYDLEHDRFAKDAWQSVPTKGTVYIHAKSGGGAPAVTFERIHESSNGVSTLDPLWVSQGTVVTLERPGNQPNTITVKTSGSMEQRLTFAFTGALRMVLDDGQLSGIGGRPMMEEESLTYRVHLGPANPAVEVRGSAKPLVLNFESHQDALEQLFSKDGVLVTRLEFTHQNEFGNRATALTAPATISYPDYPDIAKATVQPPDFLGLADLRGFAIKSIQWNQEQQGFHLTLDGVAGHIRSGMETLVKDHRLTKFDMLWHNPRLRQLLTIGKEIS